MIKIKRYITCILIFAMVLTSAVTMTVGEVDAIGTDIIQSVGNASNNAAGGIVDKGTVDALVNHAKFHEGQKWANFGKNCTKTGYDIYKDDWCLAYIVHCAVESGNGNAIPKIPGNWTYIPTYTEALVNRYNAKITFVNETSYKAHKTKYSGAKLDKSYKPQKGDLIIYYNEKQTNRDHIGLVTSKSTEPLSTIEGNTSELPWTQTKVVSFPNLKTSYRGKAERIVAYVTPNYQSFTAKYNAGCSGAWGGMPPTTMPYGIQTPLSANQYIRNGYDFAGWTAQRDDGTWLYFNPSNKSQNGWYKVGAAPSGWKKDIYRDKQTVSKTYNKNKGVVTFYAQWSKTSKSNIYYKVNNSIGFQPAIRVSKGDNFTITKSKPTKSGYTFTGWAAYRVKDMKYFVSGKGWFTEKEIQNKGYSKKLYPAGGKYTFTDSWTKGCSGNSHYVLEAQWKKIPVTTFTVKYVANGGTGSMANTTVIYGKPTALRNNQFKREGYTFAGWTAKRDNGTWRYYNPKNKSQERWCKEGQAPSGWKKYVYGNQAKVSKTYATNKGVVYFHAEWKKNEAQTFTVKYNANGGKGTMANTTVTYGTKTPLRNNQFVKEGYKFVGWTAKRDNNTWRYIQPNGSKDGWYAEGKQPSGWKKYVYRNQENVLHTYNKNKGVVTFYAQWEKAPVHTFYYDTKGGSVTPPSMQVAESTRFSITQLLPEKEGCMFEGWTVRRTADNKCYVTGKGWLTDAEIKSKGYIKRIYTPGEGYTLDAAWTNGYSGVSNYIFEAQWKRQEELSFTANYDANGGSGTMAYTTIKVGEPTPLRKNQFTRDGYEFVGWTAQKNGLEWVYTNGNGTSGWYEKNTQPTGWKKYVYKDQQNIIYNSESMDKCEVTYYAQWKETDEQTFTIKYISNGGNGYMDDTTVIYGNATPLRKNQFTKNDCTFAGWTAMRDNGTWRYISPDGSKDGWYAEGRQPENWEKFVYKDGVNVYYTYDKNKGEVYFVARWEKTASQEPVEKPDEPEPPVSEPEIIGYVSEAEYNAKYAGNSDYEATPYYRYATRQKEYTESTASSMPGWTLYNQITTPPSSTWSKTKPTSGAYETGYQYYCWGWEHKGDWTFYYDDNYNDAVAWIKKNYTVWNYNQFRYFWQVYSTNKGSSVKVSQTVNYRDNAGKTGTKAISDTKLWYDGVVYRQKASTKYQYWRWSSWSAWSGWSTQKQTTGDTVKEERQYYVVKK